MRIAVIGLGEAGRIYARGLAERGATVTGFDVRPPADALPGVAVAATAVDAVREAEVVLSLVGASGARAVADSVLPELAADAVLADLNTGAPADKLAIAEEAEAHGRLFADVAVLAPVPRAGAETPLITSGAGAEKLVERLRPLGVPIEVVGERAGDAAGLKLLRSVFMKGLAGIVFESLSAASRSGAVDWMRGQITAELGARGEPLVQRLIEGTNQHAVRREHEMRDVKAYLESLGAHSWMTDGAITWLHAIGEGGEGL